MFLSVFDIFKIGIGPSSSHTVGPMLAGARFLEVLRRIERQEIDRITVSLRGSLAFTGRGHGSDRAVVLGLLDSRPDKVDPDRIEDMVAEIKNGKTIASDGLPAIFFDPSEDLIFDYGPPLPGHANGMIFAAFNTGGEIIAEQTYYSIGGGFVVTADELVQSRNEDNSEPTPPGCFPAAGRRHPPMRPLGSTLPTWP